MPLLSVQSSTACGVGKAKWSKEICIMEFEGVELPNSTEQRSFGKLIFAQIINKFPLFHGIRRFITAFKSASHWTLSWAMWNQPTPSHPISLKSILIFSHLRLFLPVCTLLSDENYIHFLICSLCATCPANLILLDLITLIIIVEEHKLWNLRLCSFLQPLIISSLLGPNILFGILFSHTLNKVRELALKNFEQRERKCNRAELELQVMNFQIPLHSVYMQQTVNCERPTRSDAVLTIEISEVVAWNTVTNGSEQNKFYRILHLLLSQGPLSSGCCT